jgi:hypothetical protein
MMNCERPSRWRFKEYCRSVGCGVCRGRYIESQTQAALDRFSDADNHEMALLTVVLAVTEDENQIGLCFERGRKKLRNIIDAQRRRTRRWDAVEVLGWLETDALDDSQVQMVLPERRALLEHLGLPSHPAPEMPIWVITFHAVVRLPAVEHQAFRSALQIGWPHPGQVDVRPFISTKSPDANLRHVIEYALKHETITRMEGRTEFAWPSEWLAKYYEALEGWSRSFQRLRVNIRPKRRPGSTHDDFDPQPYHPRKPVELDPMPSLFGDGFSSIPTQYILGPPVERAMGQDRAWERSPASWGQPKGQSP